MTNVPVSVTSRSRYFRYYAFLWGMKKTVLLILLLATACGLQQVEVDVHSSSDGVWRGPSYGRYMSGTCYALGLDYPDGYDWKSATGEDGTKCSLVMFADGIPVLRVRTGEGYEASSDILRHRIRKGKLYSDYTDGVTTVIKEDGKELVRYEGAEEIICLEPVGGRIHTIGKPPGGTGFTYRVDGVCLVQRDSATVYPHLDEYGGRVGFCFSNTVRDADGCHQHYYCVTGGKVERVEVGPDVTMVWDMCMSSGHPCVAVSRKDKAPVVIFGDGSESDSSMNITDMVSCSFCDSETLCVCFRFGQISPPLMTDVLWMGDERLTIFGLGCTLSAVCVDEYGFSAVINPSDETDGEIYDSDDFHPMPEGYAVISRECIARKDDVLHVALSSTAGGPPVIWTPVGSDTLSINGPLFCLR